MHYLRITPSDHGVRIYLDNFELKSVTKYRLESIDADSAEFTVTVSISNSNVLIGD